MKCSKSLEFQTHLRDITKLESIKTEAELIPLHAEENPQLNLEVQKQGQKYSC
jgi:hypothetical protein